MTVWESGRESGLLDDIIAGRKTIEGRLNKGKFADYRAGTSQSYVMMFECQLRS